MLDSCPVCGGRRRRYHHDASRRTGDDVVFVAAHCGAIRICGGGQPGSMIVSSYDTTPLEMGLTLDMYMRRGCWSQPWRKMLPL